MLCYVMYVCMYVHYYNISMSIYGHIYIHTYDMICDLFGVQDMSDALDLRLKAITEFADKTSEAERWRPWESKMAKIIEVNGCKWEICPKVREIQPELKIVFYLKKLVWPVQMCHMWFERIAHVRHFLFPRANCLSEHFLEPHGCCVCSGGCGACLSESGNSGQFEWTEHWNGQRRWAFTRSSPLLRCQVGRVCGRDERGHRLPGRKGHISWWWAEPDAKKFESSVAQRPILHCMRIQQSMNLASSVKSTARPSQAMKIKHRISFNPKWRTISLTRSQSFGRAKARNAPQWCCATCPTTTPREMFLQMLDEHGMKGKYDFVYLPCDFYRDANLGYAFVNMVDSKAVDELWKIFHGFADWALPTAKVCEVSWSGPHQGFKAHIERYRNSPVMHRSVPDEYKPVMFKNGVRKPFPKPTKKVKAPF